MRIGAPSGNLGELRRDPFAMLPFCGYNMADYWGHWLKVGSFTQPSNLPRIYSVNWFRRDADGRFIWPGFGGNSRVIDWIVRRLSGKAEAVGTAVGLLPVIDQLNLDGVDLSDDDVRELFRVDAESWRAEAELTEQYFEQFGDRVPSEMWNQLSELRARLG